MYRMRTFVLRGVNTLLALLLVAAGAMQILNPAFQFQLAQGAYPEWARLLITGQLWNAVGYSQAYHPALIQVARWGGVYAVGFLIVAANATMAFVVCTRKTREAAIAMLVIASVVLAVLVSSLEPVLSPGVSTKSGL